MIDIGEVGSTGKLTVSPSFTTARPSGWKFVGSGDYLDEGHDQFLVETPAGAVIIGDYTGGATHFTLIADIAAQWTIHS